MRGSVGEGVFEGRMYMWRVLKVEEFFEKEGRV